MRAKSSAAVPIFARAEMLAEQFGRCDKTFGKTLGILVKVSIDLP